MKREKEGGERKEERRREEGERQTDDRQEEGEQGRGEEREGETDRQTCREREGGREEVEEIRREGARERRREGGRDASRIEPCRLGGVRFAATRRRKKVRMKWVDVCLRPRPLCAVGAPRWTAAACPARLGAGSPQRPAASSLGATGRSRCKESASVESRWGDRGLAIAARRDASGVTVK